MNLHIIHSRIVRPKSTFFSREELMAVESIWKIPMNFRLINYDFTSSPFLSALAISLLQKHTVGCGGGLVALRWKLAPGSDQKKRQIFSMDPCHPASGILGGGSSQILLTNSL